MGDRLSSWKEIATYLGREVRTVQRWALSRSLPVHRLPGGDRPRVFSLKPEIDAWLRAGARPSARPEPTASVAVLPFLNLTGGAEGQYFGDGLAEDVINALVRVRDLRVIARTSSFTFTSKGQDVREIGARLGAAWLIEGSVRRDGDRLRVSAQLVDTRDGCHAWSDTYDRRLSDVFAIQDEISHSIAQALKATLAGQPVAARPTDDLAAYDLWVKGRSVSQQFTAGAIGQARGCYEAAIARDSRFARAHLGLAELLFYSVQFGLSTSPDDTRLARDAIVRALACDNSLGEAHALQGVLQGILDYDWDGAESSFTRAFALCPGSAAVLAHHAWYHLVPRLRVAQALDEATQSLALDPLSPFARGLLGMVLMVARQYSRAAEECRQAVQLAPGLWWLHWFYGTALLLQGRLVQGMRQMRVVYEEVHQPLVVGAMAFLHGAFLRRKKARQFLSELESLARTTHVPPMAFAFAHMGLGDDDRMFEWLDKAIDARDPVVTHLPSMPLYDGIRDDPRFRPLLVRMHLA